MCDPDPAEQEKCARRARVETYAWNWFAYHAEQRTNMFNYSLVAASLLAAGLAGALSEGLRAVAVAIGFVGCVVAVSFWRIDRRNAELVDHSEQVLVALEKALFAGLGLQGRGGRSIAGILVVDDEKYPDRKRWKEAGFKEWSAGLRRDAKVGKHGVYLRLIAGLTSVVFFLGALGALLEPDLLTSDASRTEDRRHQDLLVRLNQLDAELKALVKAGDKSAASAQQSADPSQAGNSTGQSAAPNVQQ